jgi:hypothetical protein
MDDYLHELVDTMVGLFHISQDEATGRIARQFARWTLTSEVDEDIFGHEDCEYWARETYYGPNVQWWRLPPEDLHPMPYP